MFAYIESHCLFHAVFCLIMFMEYILCIPKIISHFLHVHSVLYLVFLIDRCQIFSKCFWLKHSNGFHLQINYLDIHSCIIYILQFEIHIICFRHIGIQIIPFRTVPTVIIRVVLFTCISQSVLSCCKIIFLKSIYTESFNN